MTAPIWGFQHATSIRFGRGCAGEIGAAARRLGARALLVTGARAFDAAPWSTGILASFSAAGVAIERFPVAGEPDTAIVDATAHAIARARAEVVVAVGGGSAMDVAKAAAVVAANGGSSLDYLEALPRGGGTPIGRDPLPVICAPTTAGTGSEVTKNAVLQAGEFRVKRSMRSERMFPELALVDPALVETCPRAVMAACGFDALTHLIEGWCSTNATRITDALASEGIFRAWDGLRQLAAGPDASYDAAANLAEAALLGGMCLANAGLGAAHGLVAPLGGLFPRAPHGAALAALLPATLRMNAAVARDRGDQRADARLHEIAISIGPPPLSIDDAWTLDRISDVAAVLVDLRHRLGLPGLRAYGIAESDLGAIADAPSGSLKTNPVPLSRDELIAILRDALD